MDGNKVDGVVYSRYRKMYGVFCSHFKNCFGYAMFWLALYKLRHQLHLLDQLQQTLSIRNAPGKSVYHLLNMKVFFSKIVLVNSLKFYLQNHKHICKLILNLSVILLCVFFAMDMLFLSNRLQYVNLLPFITAYTDYFFCPIWWSLRMPYWKFAFFFLR